MTPPPVRLDTPALSVVVDADRGAKIVSLREPDGLEWLAAADPAHPAPPRAPFVDAEMAGWDECAPSIVACEVAGASVPDHGDLWDRPFAAVGDELVAEGRSLDYRFARAMREVPGGVRFEYVAQARSTPIPFLWAAHPQFVAPPGTRVELPGVTEVVDVLDPAEPLLPWTPERATIDTVPRGGCRKVYVPPSVSARGARLVRADGRALELRWSLACPYVGVWFDGTAYSREPVIAIEPSTGYFDSLATAVERGRVPVLAPGRPLHWWVEVRPTRAAANPAGDDRRIV